VISLDRLKRKSYDMAVIGAGPAGISAALNGVLRKKNVVLIDRAGAMKKVGKAGCINNYPGLPGITGLDLNRAFLDHLREFDIEVEVKTAYKILRVKNRFVIYTKGGAGDVFEAGSVILCPGVVLEKKIEGEEELVGRGVSYCVTCDGLVYQGKNVVVISDFEDGEEEAKVLAKDYKCTVTYVPGYKVGPLPGVNVLDERPVEIKMAGDSADERDNVDKIDEMEVKFEGCSMTAAGVFIIRKNRSPASILPGIKTENGYVSVGAKMETNIKGAFAAGDCTGPPFQIAKAVGQGQAAALFAVEYLKEVLN
jgi:thioredoxin reductase (NADPH)